MKHNKKKNVGFLFECLTRELTKSIINRDPERKSKLLSVIKEHFCHGTNLNRKLDLFRTILESQGSGIDIANGILNELKKKNSQIDEKSLDTEVSNLVSELSSTFGKDFYQQFVPNYQELASIHNIFSDKTNTRNKIILEKKIVNFMAKKAVAKEDSETKGGNVVFEKYVEKFNKKYSFLNENQKKLANYLTSFDKDDVEFKIFLNEELETLRKSVAKIDDEGDSEVIQKKKEIQSLLEGFGKTEIEKIDFTAVFQIQELVSSVQGGGL